jgi:2-hydroxy-3-keto-5-methylthiopentenyl-1-phosphate phosphatase
MTDPQDVLPLDPNAAVLVTDYDGTMTRGDFFAEVLAQVRNPAVDRYWQQYLAGRRTHFAALQAIFAHLRGSADDVLRLARRAELDPRARQAVARLAAAGWQVVVVSAGCAWYIERMLAEQGIAVPVAANPGRWDPHHGLQMRLPAGSPFFSAQTGIDKAAVVRYAQQRCRTVAFAGDGRPDLDAALLVEPPYRFARGWLAEELHRRGEAFTPFQWWSEIAGYLAAPCD